MTYEAGKTYKCSGGEVLKVEEVGPETAIMRIVVGANGKIPEEEIYLEGPANNFQGFMAANGAVELTIPTPKGKRSLFDEPKE